MTNLNIKVEDWGKAKTEDIEKLLKNVAHQITRELRYPFREKIKVYPGPGPLTHWYKVDPFVVDLSAKLATEKPFWGQFIYQFAHEFCHVLSGHNRLRESPSNWWFHEALCELASSFALRSMAREWPTNAPDDNWRGYAWHMQKYECGERCEYEAILKEKYGDNINLCTWLSKYEDELREISEQNSNGRGYTNEDRAKFALIAYTLLPIFESNPSGWNTISKLPASNSHIEEYLDKWLAAVDVDDKLFIKRCKDMLVGT